MKKVLIVLAIGAFASCGRNSTTETKVKDSATVKTDTKVKKVDSTTIKTDSTKK